MLEEVAIFVDQQRKLCKKYGAEWVEAPDNLKVGIAKNVKSDLLPMNGLRHLPERDTTGWYIWAGEEFSNDPNFFQPLHVKHLKDWRPEVFGIASRLAFLARWRL